MIDKPNYKKQEETGCKELYIEPASYILNDDSRIFLPPSKALVLGLVPLISVGVFYSGVFDGALTIDTHYETHEISLPLSIAAPLVQINVETSLHILNIANQKSTIGVQGFNNSLFNEAIENKHKAFSIKKVLAKEVSTAIKKPLVKSALLRKMEQQHVRLQEKTMLSKAVKGRQKSKVTFLASKASTVRLVSSKPLKKLMPMGVLSIRSRLLSKQGRVLKANYFVIQYGKRVRQKDKTQSAVFKLPIGEYTIQAIYNGETMQKKAIVEKAQVDQLTFIYSDKKQSKKDFSVTKVALKNTEKKVAPTGEEKGIAKQSKEIQGDDLSAFAELVLRNDGYHQYASSNYLELISKHALPTGIGYSGAKL